MKTLDIILMSSISLSSFSCGVKCDIRPEVMFPEIYTRYDEKLDKNFGYCFKNYHIVEEVEDFDDEQAMYESSTVK